MKKNLLKTVIILIAVTFVTLQSCEKKEFVENEAKDSNTFEMPTYNFSKQITITDKSGVSADITVFTDNKSNLEYQFEITPIFEKPYAEHLNQNENISNEEFEEIPPVHFDIQNVKLPKNAIGYKVSHNSINKWDDTIFGYSSDYDAGFVTKTNSSGKTNYKMGVLYTGSQWFYKTIADGTLKTKSSAAQAAPGSFYKMYIKINDKSGSTCDYFFYSFE